MTTSIDKLVPLAIFAALALPARPQSVPARERLEDQATRRAAIAELQHAGPAGARAAIEWLRAAVQTRDADAADLIAGVLAELDGRATAATTTDLLALLPQQPRARRDLLLRALGNAALFVDDQHAIAIRTALPAWLVQGFFYSPDDGEPTFAWYDYVRLVRRLRVAGNGRDAAGLAESLASLLQRRRRDPLVLFLQAVPQVADAHALESFGAHGEREELEAIAELTLSANGELEPVLAELAAYLEHTLTPQAGARIVVAPQAGIGEPAPELPADRQRPTRWRYDAWRQACARAVLARSADSTARALAIRHLLTIGEPGQVCEALAALRQWPGPVDAFGTEFATVFRGDDRMLLREALITAVQLPALAHHAQASLERLARSHDRELAELARRARSNIR